MEPSFMRCIDLQHTAQATEIFFFFLNVERTLCGVSGPSSFHGHRCLHFWLISPLSMLHSCHVGITAMKTENESSDHFHSWLVSFAVLCHCDFGNRAGHPVIRGSAVEFQTPSAHIFDWLPQMYHWFIKVCGIESLLYIYNKKSCMCVCECGTLV